MIPEKFLTQILSFHLKYNTCEVLLSRLSIVHGMGHRMCLETQAVAHGLDFLELFIINSYLSSYMDCWYNFFMITLLNCRSITISCRVFFNTHACTCSLSIFYGTVCKHDWFTSKMELQENEMLVKYWNCKKKKKKKLSIFSWT